MPRILPGLFIVSQVEIADGKARRRSSRAGIEGLQIRVERAHGTKCERCWNYSTHVGENADYPTRVRTLRRRARMKSNAMAAWLPGARSPDACRRAFPGWLALGSLSLGALAADQLSKYAVEKYTAVGFAARLDSRLAESGAHHQSRRRLRLVRRFRKSLEGPLLITFSVAVIGLLVWLLATGRAGGCLASAASR